MSNENKRLNNEEMGQVFGDEALDAFEDQGNISSILDLFDFDDSPVSFDNGEDKPVVERSKDNGCTSGDLRDLFKNPSDGDAATAIEVLVHGNNLSDCQSRAVKVMGKFINTEFVLIRYELVDNTTVSLQYADISK